VERIVSLDGRLVLLIDLGLSSVPYVLSSFPTECSVRSNHVVFHRQLILELLQTIHLGAFFLRSVVPPLAVTLSRGLMKIRLNLLNQA
jgi:hypothetical protein